MALEEIKMKNKASKILAILMAVMLMIPAFACAETVSLAYSDGALNLRKGPGTDYASLGTVHNGDHITIVQSGDVWSKVKTDSGKVGYIKNLYISGSDKNYASGTSYVSGYTAYTTANVNFRSGASTSTSVMGVLSKGTKVTVLGENGGFYLVKNSKGTQGFVSKKYVSTKASSSSGDSMSTAKTKTVTGNYVNLRADGGMSAKVLKVLTKGTVVSVVKEGKYWTCVDYNGTVGWIKKTYLK